MVGVFLKNTTLCGKILHFVVKHSVLWYNITFFVVQYYILWYNITVYSTFVVYLWYICDIFVVFFAMGHFSREHAPEPPSVQVASPRSAWHKALCKIGSLFTN